MGTILRVEPDGALRVQLDDGSQLSGVFNDLPLTFYKIVPGERVCVSVVKGKPPTLTGYLTSSIPGLEGQAEMHQGDVMNEADWLSSTDSTVMLSFLRQQSNPFKRKLRLFAVACCRRIWHLMSNETMRRAVEVAERHADGLAGEEALADARKDARFLGRAGLGKAERQAVEAVFEANRVGRLAPALHWAGEAAADAMAWSASDDDGSDVWKETRNRECAAQAALLRDIFGCLPFSPLPPIEPSVRTWNEGLIKRLAEVAYQDRLLPSGHLNPQRLAVLADALEEAGADGEMVEHLHGPGPHYRGCWCVDSLTGRD